MLAIMVALKYEVKNLLENLKPQIINNHEFYFLNEDTIVCFSGIGKANAASAVTNLLNNFEVDAILNVGTCGSANKNINSLDIVLVQNNLYGDVDVSIDETLEINQLPREQKYFQTNFKINEIIEKVLLDLNLKFKLGNCLTTDSFVNNNNSFKFNELDNPHNCAIDMESAAIAQICSHYQVNFSCLKFVSDVIDSHNNHDQFLANVKIINGWIDSFILKFLEVWKKTYGQN